MGNYYEQKTEIMKSFNHWILIRAIRTSAACLLLLGLTSWEKKTLNLFTSERSNGPQKIVVKSEGMSFGLPEEIKSGWNTFRNEIRTGNPLYFVVEKLPAGKIIEDSKAEKVPAFQKRNDLIAEGNFNIAMQILLSLQNWYWSVMLHDGPSLVSSGQAAEATVAKTWHLCLDL